MSGKKAKQARQAVGYIKPAKEGTPFSQRIIPMIFDKNAPITSAYHPSRRKQRKLLGYMEAAGQEIPTAE